MAERTLFCEFTKCCTLTDLKLDVNLKYIYFINTIAVEFNLVYM